MTFCGYSLTFFVHFYLLLRVLGYELINYCSIFYSLLKYNDFLKLIVIKLIEFMLYIYIMDYNVYLLLYIFLDVFSIFILIYLWFVNKSLYVKHPYIFWFLNFVLIVAIIFFSYKVCYIVYMKGNSNMSKNSGNSGSSNNNPKFNGKPNFISGVPKQRKSKIKRDVYEALDFKFTEYDTSTWRLRVDLIDRRYKITKKYRDIYDSMSNKVLTFEDEKFLYQKTEEMKRKLFNWQTYDNFK